MWAAGCILAEMLTGRMLFAGTLNVCHAPSLNHELNVLQKQKLVDIKCDIGIGKGAFSASSTRNTLLCFCRLLLLCLTRIIMTTEKASLSIADVVFS